MKTISAFLIFLALTLMSLACAHERKHAQTPPEQSQLPKGTALVKELPGSVEGVELKDGSLKLKPGFTFEKDPRHGFVIARMSGGQHVTSGGCGCTGGTCDPVLKGGIIVCESSGCTGSCGLALTIAGVRMNIIRY